MEMDGVRIGTLLRFKDMTDERLRFLRGIGMNCLQTAGLNGRFLTSEGKKEAEKWLAACAGTQLPVTSLFISLGELNLGAEEQSGIGFSPVAFRGPRAALACREIAWAAMHGIRRFICHAGPVPPEGRMLFVQTLIQLAEMCADFGAELLLESGQETAEAMEKLLADIDRPNVGINFDPANLVYYGNTAPAEFWTKLRGRIRGLHCKDAVRPLPGAEHGGETPLGAGEVGFTALLETMLAAGFREELIVERELPPGPELERDLADATTLLKRITRNAEAKR